MTTPHLYVSYTAARQYAAVLGIPDVETARRDLTELLLDARPNERDPSLWRYRRRSSGVDVSARVAVQGRLAVVTTINVRRDVRAGPGGT